MIESKVVILQFQLELCRDSRVSRGLVVCLEVHNMQDEAICNSMIQMMYNNNGY